MQTLMTDTPRTATEDAAAEVVRLWDRFHLAVTTDPDTAAPAWAAMKAALEATRYVCDDPELVRLLDALRVMTSTNESGFREWWRLREALMRRRVLRGEAWDDL